MKIATIVGARPQFIKAAAFSRELRKRHHEFLIHTGQHYDYAMSGVFFDGLEMPAPDTNLEIGSGSHGAQTGAMLAAIEKILLEQKPDWILVYGDTNSTLAGALAASKLQIPVVHVEAGLRSFNRAMPEEVNRVLTDHISDLLFCPSQTAVNNLCAEGIRGNVHLVGDVMLDVLTWAGSRANERAHETMRKVGVSEQQYLLATVHRSENTDDPARLTAILNAFNAVGETIVFPVHPRTRKVIKEQNQSVGSNIKLIDPLSYFDMVAMSKGARLILTDSGGLQKEAYWLGVPCITLRDQTEWVETVDSGWNLLTGANREKIIHAVRAFAPPAKRPALYGADCVSGKCVEVMENAKSSRASSHGRIAVPEDGCTPVETPICTLSQKTGQPVMA